MARHEAHTCTRTETCKCTRPLVAVLALEGVTQRGLSLKRLVPRALRGTAIVPKSGGSMKAYFKTPSIVTLFVLLDQGHRPEVSPDRGGYRVTWGAR